MQHYYQCGVLSGNAPDLKCKDSARVQFSVQPFTFNMFLLIPPFLTIHVFHNVSHVYIFNESLDCYLKPLRFETYFPITFAFQTNGI